MIEIELDDERALQALSRLADAAADPAPLLKQFGEYEVESTKRRFDTGTAPDGAAWAPLSEITIARKGHAQPLIGESKDLKNEINYQLDGSDLLIGSPMIYAGTQQFGAQQGAFGTTSRGGPIPWGDIPARPFLGLSDEDIDELFDMSEDYLGAAFS